MKLNRKSLSTGKTLISGSRTFSLTILVTVALFVGCNASVPRENRASVDMAPPVVASAEGPAFIEATVGEPLVEMMVNLGFQLPKEEITAPTFTLNDLSGTSVTLESYRDSIVLLNFWATWCGPCRFEMPSMQALYDDLKDEGLAMVAVNLQETPEQVRPFIEGMKLSFDILLDRRGEVGREYGTRALPTSFLIGKDGTIITRVIGGRDWNTPEIKAVLRTLLQS